jgi:hypothetical protein
LARTSPTFSDIAKWVCTTWFEGAANPLPIACSTHTPNQISVYGNTEFQSAYCVLQNSRANLQWHSRKKSNSFKLWCSILLTTKFGLCCQGCMYRERKQKKLPATNNQGKPAPKTFEERQVWAGQVHCNFPKGLKLNAWSIISHDGIWTAFPNQDFK